MLSGKAGRKQEEDDAMKPWTVRVYDARFQSAFSERITRRLSGREGLTVTRDPASGVAGRKALIAFTPPTDEEIAGYDWIHVAGAGIDKIRGALDPSAETLPAITRTLGSMGDQMAEYCLAYILGDFQRFAEREDAEASRDWDQGYEAHRFLFESRIAIIGTGGIGQAIACRLAPLAGSVIGFSQSGRKKDGFEAVHALGDSAAKGELAHCDAVILALPGTPDTEGVIGEDLLREMKDGLLINVGRGEVLDLGALQAALAQRHIRRAVLDVFPEEPLPPGHWCWTHPKVTVTSHVSGITRPEDTAEAFLRHLVEARGDIPESPVDIRRGY
jgi:phosphoglycerate dehydrogenase-like enzyme